MQTFADVILARAGDEQTGLRFEEQSWTWDEVVRAARVRGAYLDSFVTTPKNEPGRREQVHVGILMENVPEFVFWTFGAALQGGVVVGVNPTRRGRELQDDITHVACDLVVTDSKMVHHLADLDLGGIRVLLTDGDDYPAVLAPFDSAADGFTPAVPPVPKDILLLLFSSGSTGRPKAVICGQGRLAMLARTLGETRRISRETVSYIPMPMFHGNSLMSNLAPVTYFGATACLARKFSASGFSRDIHYFGATFANYVGRALSYVLTQPEDPRDRTSTLINVFGTEASTADIARFSARFGCDVEEGYGMSEGVIRINVQPDTPTGSLGRPVGDLDVRVMNSETGIECERAQIDATGRLVNGERAVGEIVVIGRASAFEGYFRNPGATAERVRGDDFWTGDLAYRDDAGWFYFAGRSNDWLRVDSENFAAAPVERILERFPGVAVAAVYAVPDARTGDQLMCTLQFGDDFDPVLFRDFLDKQADLGTKAVPMFVRIAEQMPLTGSNKVAKPVLRSQAWATTDHIWWRGVNRDPAFRPFTDADRSALEAEFSTHGRMALFPSGGTIR